MPGSSPLGRDRTLLPPHCPDPRGQGGLSLRPARLPLPAPPARQVPPGKGGGLSSGTPEGTGGRTLGTELPAGRSGRGLAREGRRRRGGWGGGPGRPGCQGGGSGSGPAQRPRREGGSEEGRRAGGRARRGCPTGTRGRRERGHRSLLTLVRQLIQLRHLERAAPLFQRLPGAGHSGGGDGAGRAAGARTGRGLCPRAVRGRTEGLARRARGRNRARPGGTGIAPSRSPAGPHNHS